MLKKIFKSKNRLIIIILVFMAAFLALNGSFLGLLHNVFELRKLKKDSAALDAEYETLTAEYKKITEGDDSYIEDAARVKYHMSKPGEIEFRLAPKDK